MAKPPVKPTPPVNTRVATPRIPASTMPVNPIATATATDPLLSMQAQATGTGLKPATQAIIDQAAARRAASPTAAVDSIMAQAAATPGAPKTTTAARAAATAIASPAENMAAQAANTAPSRANTISKLAPVADDAIAVASNPASTVTNVAAIGESSTIKAAGVAPKGLVGLATKAQSLFPASMRAASPLTMGTLLGGLSVAVTGLQVGGFIDSQDWGGENSNLDRGLTGIATGAGLGAGAAITIGLAAGPVGWAALGGAALFGIGEAFLWGDDDSTEDQMHKAIEGTTHTIDTLLNNPEFGIDSETKKQIHLEVSAATAFYLDSGDKAGLDAYLKNLASTVPGFLMQSVQQQQVTQQRMELQAVYGPVYANLMERSAEAYQTSFDTEMAAAARIGDPKLRAAYERQAAQSLASNQALSAAYARQVAGAAQSTTGTGTSTAAQGELDRVQQLMDQAMAGTGNTIYGG